MAEIKSTLDLIMEKTKHLTMTEEEKRIAKRKEWEEKVRGWIQKYKDGTITLRDLKSIRDASLRDYEEITHLLKKEIVKHIQLENDNTAMLEILKEVEDVNVEPITSLITQYEEKLHAYSAAREQTLTKILKDKGIYGSAVVPNLRHDSEWCQYRKKIDEDFQQHIAKLTGN